MTSPEPPACYLHADREAVTGCQRCGRPICGDCVHVTRGAYVCPPCAEVLVAAPQRSLTDVFGRPYVALVLIAINVAVAAICLLQDSQWVNGSISGIMRDGALIGGAKLVSPGSVETVGVAHGQWYRVITAAFLHAGPIHLGFNMFALWQAGLLLEGKLGRFRFGLVFAVSVLGGAFGALLLSPNGFTVGASGGIFGLFGALFVAERKGLFGRRGTSFGLLIVINLVLTVAIPGISVGGHLGGLAAGTLVSWVMFEYQSRGLSKQVPIALAFGLGLVLFAGCLWAATLATDKLYRV
jgi:membrane associated rhomboid family serine protease